MEQAEIVALIVGLTQIVKQLGVPSRFLPLVAAVIGGLSQVALSYGTTGFDPMVSAVQGVITGMIASGVIGAVKDLKN